MQQQQQQQQQQHYQHQTKHPTKTFDLKLQLRVNATLHVLVKLVKKKN
jgi:hypothetical protein